MGVGPLDCVRNVCHGQSFVTIFMCRGETVVIGKHYGHLEYRGLDSLMVLASIPCHCMRALKTPSRVGFTAHLAGLAPLSNCEGAFVHPLLAADEPQQLCLHRQIFLYALLQGIILLQFHLRRLRTGVQDGECGTQSVGFGFLVIPDFTS